MREALRYGLWGLGLALCGCAGAPDVPTAAEASAINLGELSPDSDNAVVQIRTVRPPPGDGEECSGTLVAPNVMLTSLECVTMFNSMLPVTCRVDGTLDTTTTAGGVIGDPVTPHDVRVYYGSSIGDEAPSAYGEQIFVTGTPEVCEDDLAVVVLDRALPTQGYTLRLSREVSLGEELTAIGWGQTRYDSRFRRDLPVIDVGPDSMSDSGSSAPPRSFLVGSGLCWADRGGPALATDSGALAGIYARPLSGGLCLGPEGPDVDGVHRFLKLSPYVDMIKQAFDAAGATLVTDLPSESPPAHAHSGCTLSATDAPGSGALVAFVVGLMGVCLRKRARSV